MSKHIPKDRSIPYFSFVHKILNSHVKIRTRLPDFSNNVRTLRVVNPHCVKSEWFISYSKGGSGYFQENRAVIRKHPRQMSYRGFREKNSLARICKTSINALKNKVSHLSTICPSVLRSRKTKVQKITIIQTGFKF